MFDERKFTELLLLVATRLCHATVPQAPALADVLYLIECAHVRRARSLLTGARFVRTPSGAEPDPLAAVQWALTAGGHVDLVPREFLGYQSFRVVPLRPADPAVFTADEVATVDVVLADLDGLGARHVAELVRAEPGWQLVGDGETMPSEAALVGARAPRLRLTA
jgi:hypothetical protein